MSGPPYAKGLTVLPPAVRDEKDLGVHRFGEVRLELQGALQGSVALRGFYHDGIAFPNSKPSRGPAIDPDARLLLALPQPRNGSQLPVEPMHGFKSAA